MSGQIEAIVLAAGAGSRFGGGKLLVPYKGGALIDRAVCAALAAPVHKVTLVTGHDGDRVAEAGRKVAGIESRRLSSVRAADYSEGMAASLRAGIKALSPDTTATLVFLGDMPETPANIAARLINALGTASAAAPTFDGRRGHPVLFASCLFPSLLQLAGDRGASGLLSRLGDDLVLVEADDPGIHYDVDRPSDIFR